MKQIKIEKLFLKEVLFIPLDRIRFICGLVVQLKNNTHQYCVYTPKSRCIYATLLII